VTGVVRQVRAAGGVIERDGLVAVVHRPRYDDWSLPKGKLDRGESFEEAALREVLEETGLECVLGEELPEVRYMDLRGRPKTVRYWRMHVTGGEFAANDEVDALRWLTPKRAVRLLSYEHDRRLVQALADGR
jgi:8-oxo-dGTP diphosphatase